MKTTILIISSFLATAIGRSIYISRPSVDLVSSQFDRQFITPSSRGVVPYRAPLRLSATPRYIQRPFGLAPQATFDALHRPPFYPEDHHAFASRRRLDHAHHHGDSFGSIRSHRHTLHSEREERRERSRRRRRLRRLIQRHREAEEKAALQGRAL